jgi:hypothetical protein
MFNYLTQPINGKRFIDKEKKNLNTHLNNKLKNNLRPMWNYNTKMANIMVNEVYSINDTAAIMNQLSMHYDIETPTEPYYFKELEWNITVLKMDVEPQKSAFITFLFSKIKLNSTNITPCTIPNRYCIQNCTFNQQQ